MATRSSALIMPTVRLSLANSFRIPLTLLRALEALPDDVEELLHRFGALNQFSRSFPSTHPHPSHVPHLWRHLIPCLRAGDACSGDTRTRWQRLLAAGLSSGWSSVLVR